MIFVLGPKPIQILQLACHLLRKSSLETIATALVLDIDILADDDDEFSTAGLITFCQ